MAIQKPRFTCQAVWLPNKRMVARIISEKCQKVAKLCRKVPKSCRILCRIAPNICPNLVPKSKMVQNTILGVHLAFLLFSRFPAFPLSRFLAFSLSRFHAFTLSGWPRGGLPSEENINMVGVIRQHRTHTPTSKTPFSLSRFPAFLLSRFLAFSLSRFPAFPLSRFLAFSLSRFLAFSLPMATMWLPGYGTHNKTRYICLVVWVDANRY